MESLNSSINLNAERPVGTALNKPVLRQGSRGQAVTELQRLLAHWGVFRHDRPLDGIFDAEVETNVKSYQFAMFLKEDGIVGQITWQAFYSGAPVNMPILRLGASGQAVITLQQVLRNTGDYTGHIDGAFGSRTDSAVRAFQRRCNLVADGIVGNRTWHALSKTRLMIGCAF